MTSIFNWVTFKFFEDMYHGITVRWLGLKINRGFRKKQIDDRAHNSNRRLPLDTSFPILQDWLQCPLGQDELTKPARHSHRILWRNSSNMLLEHWRMVRVTFGIATCDYYSTGAMFESVKYTANKNAKQTILMDF